MDQATFRKLKMLFEPVESPDKLDEWLQYFCGIEFPWDSPDPLSTSSPLKALWGIYNFMLTGKGPSTHIIAAARGTMKTLTGSAIHSFSSLHFRRDGGHIAATLNQSSAATGYLNNIIGKISEKVDFNEYIDVHNFRMLKLKNLPATDFALKSVNKTKIVTASLKGANSDRASLLLFDETDLIPQSILDEASLIFEPSIPKMDEVQFPPCYVYLSSRKTNAGPMQKLIERAEKKNEYDRLHKWSASDFMKKCPPSIHKPELPKQVAYLNTSSLETIWGDEEFKKTIPEHGRGEWRAINAFEGCKTCPAWIPCLSNSARQKGEAPALRTKEVMHTALRNVSDPSYLVAQVLNFRPESKGLVFQQFSRFHHLKAPHQFYEWATGKQYIPEGMSLKEYEDAIENAPNSFSFTNLMPTKERCYNDMVTCGWEFNIGVDWGAVDACTAHVVGFHPKLKRGCVLHYEQSQMANHLWAQYIENNIANRLRPVLMCPDLADASSSSYFKKHSCFMEKFQIDPGVSFIRGLLWNPIRSSYDFCIYDDSIGSGENNNLIVVDSMEKWSHKRTPSGESDLSKFMDGAYTHACFAPGTTVNTISGPVNIEDVKIGDMVLTHKNRYRPVTAVMNSEFNGNMKVINPFGAEPITVTPNHTFWTSGAKRSCADGKSGQLLLSSVYDWVPAEKLQKTIKNARDKQTLYSPSYMNESGHIFDMKALIPDWIESDGKLCPPCGSKKAKAHTGKRSCNLLIPVTKEIAFMVGYFAAEGSCSQSKCGGTKKAVTFAGHQKETNVTKLIQSAMDQLDGNKVLWREGLGKGRNIYANSKVAWVILKPMGSHLRKHYPDWINNLEQNEKLAVIAGYAFGDGHFSPSGLIMNSISKQIAYVTKNILVNLGYSPNIRYQKRKGRWAGFGTNNIIDNDQYIVNLNRNETLDFLRRVFELGTEFKDTFQDKNISTIKSHMPSNKTWNANQGMVHLIKDVSEIVYTGTVYNLEVEEDESYTANGIAVHNCDSLRYALAPYIKAAKISTSSGQPSTYNTGLIHPNMTQEDKQVARDQAEIKHAVQNHFMKEYNVDVSQTPQQKENKKQGKIKFKF
jgi:intein/homing endonuclease